MKKDKISIETLKNIGLTENEAQVYIAALSLGSATILKISRTAEIKRTTVYSVIESLKKKGLINIEVRGLKQLYAAEHPKKLSGLLDSRKQQFQGLLPELTALYNLKGGESFIKCYEGLEGIKSVYENLLQSIRPREEYLVITNQEHWLNLDQPYFQRFIERRAKLPITPRLLFTDSPVAREHKKFEKNYNEKVKILPKDTSLTTNLVITPQRVVIHQLTPPLMAIVIENKSVIEMHKELFEMIWQSLPE